LSLIERLLNVPVMTDKQVELAHRLAFGIFLLRPVRLVSSHVNYSKEKHTKMTVRMNDTFVSSPTSSPDVLTIKWWIESCDEDYLNDEMID